MKNYFANTIEEPRSDFIVTKSKEIGLLFRKKREEKNITIETIHKKTFISHKYLYALENGDFSQFPAEVYLTGTIRRYAPYLGLNADELINMYYQSNRVNKEVKLPSSNVQKSSSSFKYLLPISIFLLLIAIGSIWYRVSNLYKPPKIDNDQQLALIQEPEKVKVLNLSVKSKITSWVKISADNKNIFEGMLASGDTKEWTAKDKFTLKIGYTPGLEVKLNGNIIDVQKGAVQDVNTLTLDWNYLKKFEQNL